MPKRIKMYGPFVNQREQIVHEFWGIESISTKKIIDLLPEDGSDIVIEVSSNGGLVSVGSEIYTHLKNYKGHITVEITGMAASAASVAIMGADKVLISPTAQIMIHKAGLSSFSGNSDDFEKAAKVLKASDQAIVNAYLGKTNLTQEELMKMMSDNSFMHAEEAVNKGFADEVMNFENEEYKIVAALESGLLPKAIIDDYYAKEEGKQIEIKAMLFDLEKEKLLEGL